MVDLQKQLDEYVTKPKIELSREVQAALKVLNDSLQRAVNRSVPHSRVRNAVAIIQAEWFKVSGARNADPHIVEQYVDVLEDYSKRLLEYVVNMSDSMGNTAMHYAVSHGNFDVVSILLDSKVCNVNSLNEAGYSPTMLVSLAQISSDADREVIKRLFKLADVNAKAIKHGQTTLMLAVSQGKKDIVRLLLECGADINIRDNDGSTALMCAAEHGHLDILELLISESDCDITAKDNSGKSALMIAMGAGHREVGLALYKKEHHIYESQSSKNRTTVSAPSSPRLKSPFKLKGSVNDASSRSVTCSPVLGSSGLKK